MSNLFDEEHRDGTVVENFDRYWRRTLISHHGTDEIFASREDDEQHGELIELPDQHKEINMDGYLYHKKFHFTKEIDRQSQFFLIVCLDKSEEIYREIPGVSIWLNGTNIFQGDISLLSFDITGYLKENEDNNFVIYSHEGHPFSLCISLIDCPMPLICVNEPKLDFTASLSHCDGLIDFFIDSFEFIDNDVSLDPSWDQITLEEIQQSRDDEVLMFVPRISILMLIVGTRGDVQPFIALGKALLAFGHRVRLATHQVFENFVRENGLEFYPLAGDPADLMSFMVKNSGVFPSLSSIIHGDVGKNRQIIKEILESTWEACIRPDQRTNVSFVAEAIIANPPSYGHIHCAQKLKIPLHMMFTMPWSPTGAFPHPLCRIDSRKTSARLNRFTYKMMETLIWSGLQDLINTFREKTLKLPSITTATAVTMLEEEAVPFTYCWSPSLVTRPNDWPHNVNVCGFFFLDLATNYEPPSDLVKFIESGPAPVYIGFGSITGHDAHRLSILIVDALKETGYRAIISNLPIEKSSKNEKIFEIGNCPHDWLFHRVSAVCHHGGAGTTAAGLRAGKPTIIVPFFGDQFFWGSMIHQRGAGPIAVPGKDLKVDDFVKALRFVHQDSTRQNAVRLSQAFQDEDGCRKAVDFFHKSLPLNRMCSDFEQTYSACFSLEKFQLKISRPIAEVLLVTGRIKKSDLTANPVRTWSTFEKAERAFVPFKNFLGHEKKALRSIFTRKSKRRNEKDETIFQGLGHASIGCLAFYGDLTDALENLPNLYDSYKDPEQKTPEEVKGISDGVRAAGSSIWNGLKGGVTDIVKKPQRGYKVEGAPGLMKGAIIAVPNAVIKPISGTLASITWLSRGLYAEAKKFAKTDKDPESVSVFLSNTKNLRQTTENSDRDPNSEEARAALFSGFNENICRAILQQFDQVRQDSKYLRRQRSRSVEHF